VTEGVAEPAGPQGGAGGSEGSLEFLTFTTAIERIAAHYRMVPVRDYGEDALEA
jgi:hypothetical protein